MSDIDKIYDSFRKLAPAPTFTEPVPSAVCILWRKNPDFQIYLVRRSPKLRFLGGFWTFPGGKVDAEDRDPRHTACRELFEETGVRVLADQLVAAGRFTTPSVAPLRFAADYFLAEWSEEHAEPDARHSQGELVDGAWKRPDDILSAARAGRLLVPAPALRVVEALRGGFELGSGARIAALGADDHDEVVRLWPIAGGVHLCPLRTPTLPPATHTNCWIVGEDELVVIDPASPYPEEQELLFRALDLCVAQGRKIAEVWLTHHHGDHVGAAAAVAARYGVAVAAHPETARRLEGIVPVSVHLTDGHRRVLAGDPERRLRCLHTPGHAPGHLCFLEEATGFMVAGDMVAGVGTILIDPAEGDMAEYLSSLERMAREAPRLLLPAHGMVLTEPLATLEDYRKHRLWREQRICQALEPSPQVLAQLVAKVYADTPVAVHPLAERSLLAHLVKLEREGRARQSLAGWSLR